MSAARRRLLATKQTVQHLDAFSYAAESWPQTRHVVMTAEVSEHGATPRFVVTSLSEFAPALLYHAYCERGQGENFIKAHQENEWVKFDIFTEAAAYR